MILKLMLILLIFTNEIITASINRDKTDSDKFEVSPVSTVFIAGSPDLASTSRKTTRKLIRPTLALESLGSDMVLYIGEYLEFPNLTLGQLSRVLRQIFRTISPSQVISNQLALTELINLQVSSDLKYLTSLNKMSFNDERLLTIIIDVALIKKLPNVKSSLLRLLYLKALKTVSREQLLEAIHPFKNSYSPLAALVTGFFESNDFEYLFDILERFPELILDELLFSEKFIEAASESGKLDFIYEVYSRNLYVTLQKKFDFVCKCLSVTFDGGILNLFLREAYRLGEYWNDNYTETVLNAWIFALTQSNTNIKGVSEVFDHIRVSNVHLAVRKQMLNLLLSIRVTKNIEKTRLLLERFLIDFDSSASTFKQFYEEILWALVFEEDYENFFFLLRSFDRLDHLSSSKLRLAIAKTQNSVFISRLFDGFNVNALFSNNFYGEAVYNKRLFLALTHHSSQEDFIQTSLLTVDLFKYAVEHFKTVEDWEQFFRIKSDWSAVTFAQFFEYLLNNSVDISVFELMTNLLTSLSLRIATWGRPGVLLSIETAEFLLKNGRLHYLLIYFNRFVKFTCEPTVMSHLITSNCCSDGHLLQLLDFSVNDLLLQLPHWLDHQKYRRLFGLNFKSYLIQLKTAMTELKRLNSAFEDQDSFDKILLQLFNPILSKLQWDIPVDYLRLLLIRKFANDPVYMKKAVVWAVANGRLNELAFLARGNVLKVEGPVDIETVKESLKIHKIRLIIE